MVSTDHKSQTPNTKPQTINSKLQTPNPKPIPLFFWSERKFIFKDKENYGDLLSKYLIEKISGKQVKFVHPKKQAWYKWNKRNYLAIGSIIHHATKDSVVWGSGIIDSKQIIAPAQFRAVRGPQTRNFLLNLGYNCPEVYGDPAILLPNYYSPKVEKKYKLGIVPHYHDHKDIFEKYKNDPEILIIDMMTLDVESVTRKFLECEKTISSSLHGLIVSHAYGIPSIWVEFSDKLFGNGVKFIDYLESVELPIYRPEFIEEKISLADFIKLMEKYPVLPQMTKLKELQKSLLTNCPFVN